MVGANLWLEHLHGWSIYGWSICTVGASMVRAFSRLEQLDSDIADYGWSGLWLEQIYGWSIFMVGAFRNSVSYLWLEHPEPSKKSWSIIRFGVFLLQP